ncbi:hypothetical protein EB118_06615 [bacterium]|nr:hypothetical protein [bacterium]
MSNMMLITSTWKDGKTFKMIPTTADCPFVECIFDPQIKVLAVISRNKKDQFHMITKLDSNGDPEKRKTPGRNGNPYKEERRALETYQEYYIEEKSEIEDFIKHFASNADSYDYAVYLNMVPAETSETSTLQ